MAFELHRPGFQQAFSAASDLPPKVPVSLSASTALQVVAAASLNLRPFGVNGLATGAQGKQLTVYEEGNVVKAVAAASLGANAEVAVGTTTGRLIPLAVASGTKKWAVGIALDAAADGETFSLYVKPRLTGQTLDS